MRTLSEAKASFTPNSKLTESQKQRMFKVQKAFEELLGELYDLCPDNADRHTAVYRLREIKFLAVQSITHDPQLILEGAPKK